ncbi:MAG: tetratricopeptide repeat protein [Planctomycetota bacterium]
MSSRVALVCVALFAAFAAHGYAALRAAEAPSGEAAPAAAAAPAAPTAPTAAIEEVPEVKKAVELFQSRDFEGARKQLEAAVKSRPELPPAEILLTQLFAQAGNLSANERQARVQIALEQAAHRHPTDPEAFVILGDLALRGQRVAEASLLYEKASELLEGFKGSPQRREKIAPRVLAGQAAVEEARGEWANAQKLLEAWLALEPTNTNVMQRTARAMFQQKNAAGALAMLQKAKEADSTVLQPEAHLALFYEAYPDHENAKKWMAEALKKAPEDLRTRLVAAQWALETGQLEAAKEHTIKAMSIDSKSLEAKVLRGVVALFLKDYPDAEVYFEAASWQSPASFAAANNLAIALAEQNDPAKLRRALETARKNAAAFDNTASAPEAASTLGWVLYKSGRLDEAEQALRVAAASGNIQPDTAYYIARVSADRGRKEDAIRLLSASLESKTPFSMRQEAEALLKELKGDSN